jgi:glutamate N-acetyltransferase/amino-acid N-acetyltransferase
MVSVDNDTSTSDTVTLFANGAANEVPITEDHPAAPLLQEAITAVARHLAREIARDGEGATKLIEIRITGAATEAEARRAARTISASPLVALAGPDVLIHAHLGAGSASAVAWGCDLTEGYVKINAEYTT